MIALMLVAALALQQEPVKAADSAGTHAALVSRGVSVDVAAQVGAVVREANDKGLPGGAIADKAVEGAFKRVPPPRILAAVRDFSQRLERARGELRAGGVAVLTPGLYVGSAEAALQGIARAEQVAIIRAAPDQRAAASGLSVAAALVVQGIDARTSARLVQRSFVNGRDVAQVLDLPAAARALQVQGVTATEAGRQLLDGISAAGSVTGRAGATVQPVIPPVRVP